MTWAGSSKHPVQIQGVFPLKVKPVPALSAFHLDSAQPHTLPAWRCSWAGVKVKQLPADPSPVRCELAASWSSPWHLQSRWSCHFRSCSKYLLLLSGQTQPWGVTETLQLHSAVLSFELFGFFPFTPFHSSRAGSEELLCPQTQGRSCRKWEFLLALLAPSLGFHPGALYFLAVPKFL